MQETAPKKATKKGKPGRPKGSKNKNRTEVAFSAFQLQLQGCIRQALSLIGCTLAMDYFVYDGALGHNAGLQMVKQLRLHLISKLRHDSTLYFPFESEYSGKGKPRKYGEQFTIDILPEGSLRERTVKKDIETSLHQVQVWHKNFPDLLNVVVIVKRNLKTGKVANAENQGNGAQRSDDF